MFVLSGTVDRGKFNSTAAAHNNGVAVQYVGLVIARDDTAGTAILASPIGRFFVNANGDFLEHGSGSTLSQFKIGRFQVSTTFASFSDGSAHMMIGQTFIGTRAGGDWGMRVNNSKKLFLNTTGMLQFAGQTSSEPALKRNSTVLEVKLADDSNFTELKAKVLRISDGAFMLRSAAAMTNGAAAQAGTPNNAPAAGDPTKWIPFDDNGTTRYIPAW